MTGDEHSGLPRELEEAYRRTIYRVSYGGDAIDVRIGEGNPTLDRVLDQEGWEDWIIITAFNPRSVRLLLSENEERDRQLRNELVLRGLTFCRSEAIDPEEEWPAESGFLVPGLNLEAAAEIARRYDQNAIVFGEVRGPAELHVATVTNR
jgi:Protein of unknown function (DUF3293)